MRESAEVLRCSPASLSTVTFECKRAGYRSLDNLHASYSRGRAEPEIATDNAA
jgi:hypothetical protein